MSPASRLVFLCTVSRLYSCFLVHTPSNPFAFILCSLIAFLSTFLLRPPPLLPLTFRHPTRNVLPNLSGFLLSKDSKPSPRRVFPNFGSLKTVLHSIALVDCWSCQTFNSASVARHSRDNHFTEEPINYCVRVEILYLPSGSKILVLQKTQRPEKSLQTRAGQR
ncbi:hypothetical protein VTL71DRAFT_3281 [Oculimacula yallundae]|uniref:C2H2-type domain-containing protein n=1 Tax=Oculimacula yallundae TaxID=86028 RepID=A0ABR4C8I9_9HELO